MQNPYKPPTAELDNGIVATASRLKWKIFFWFIASLQALSIPFYFIFPDELDISYLIGDLVVYSTILTGIFGFAYNKKILFPRFWLYLIPVGISWDIYSLFFMKDFEMDDDTDNTELFILIGITVIFVLPLIVFQYLALYFYSDKSAKVWS